MLSIRRNPKQSGFTLMELLIVIAVLGLLLGMLIPRLGGVTDDTVDTVCDTNNKGIRYFTQMFYNQKGSMPNGLTNLVDKSSGSAALPSYEDEDTAGAEILAEEFWTRNWPGLYQLDADEVAELKDMGITTVYDLVGDNHELERETLASGDSVAMVGISYDGTTAEFKAEDTVMTDGDTTADETFDSGLGVGNPTWLGRIMMAVNDNCELVSEGFIQASALCPGAVLNEDSFSHKEYVLILPRLEATVAKLAGDGSTAGAIATLTPDEEITFSEASGGEIVTDGREIIFEFSAQEPWQFDMSCPEGHKWPDYDEDHWLATTGSGLDS